MPSPDPFDAGDVDDATPLDPEEADGLIPTHIRTRRELNAWEQANIEAARSASISTREFSGMNRLTMR